MRRISWAAETYFQDQGGTVVGIYALSLSIRGIIKSIQEEQELKVDFKVLRNGDAYFKNALHFYRRVTQGSLTPFKAETLRLSKADTIPLREG